jgi:hypothetical protein
VTYRAGNNIKDDSLLNIRTFLLPPNHNSWAFFSKANEINAGLEGHTYPSGCAKLTSFRNLLNFILNLSRALIFFRTSAAKLLAYTSLRIMKMGVFLKTAVNC